MLQRVVLLALLIATVFAAEHKFQKLNAAAVCTKCSEGLNQVRTLYKRNQQDTNENLVSMMKIPCSMFPSKVMAVACNTFANYQVKSMLDQMKRGESIDYMCKSISACNSTVASTAVKVQSDRWWRGQPEPGPHMPSRVIIVRQQRGGRFGRKGRGGKRGGHKFQTPFKHPFFKQFSKKHTSWFCKFFCKQKPCPTPKPTTRAPTTTVKPTPAPTTTLAPTTTAAPTPDPVLCSGCLRTMTQINRFLAESYVTDRILTNIITKCDSVKTEYQTICRTYAPVIFQQLASYLTTISDAGTTCKAFALC